MKKDDNSNLLLLSLLGLSTGLAVVAALRDVKPFNVEGKTILITGGSRGLGLVMARQLASEGANVVVCARNESDLDAARENLENYGSNVFTYTCDVTKRDQVNDLVNACHRNFKQIDVLINNAGTIQVGPMESMTVENYEEAMNIHFWAPLYTTLAVLPEMKKRREGRIVNISSIGGKISMPHLLPYCASKFALTGFSEGLHAELKKDGIKVTTVCPGLMRTGSPRNITTKGDHEKEYAWFSITDSLPLLSVSAEYAAENIIQSMKRGDAELVLSLPAKLATAFHGIFPGMTSEILTVLNHFLPEATSDPSEKKGYESFSEASPSRLTSLTEKAAEKNNEI